MLRLQRSCTRPHCLFNIRRNKCPQEARRMLREEIVEFLRRRPTIWNFRKLLIHKERERRRLLKRMPANSICCEIGVDTGDFSQAILNITQPAKLHLVDPWAYQSDAGYPFPHYFGGVFKGSLYGGEKGGAQGRMDQRFHAVQTRFAEQLHLGRVVIHRNYSHEAATDFSSEYFDWVYIDGNHLYEYVLNDLKTYYPKVKPDGFLAGDDYRVPGWWEGGVEKAVDEFVASGAVELLKIDGSQFILRKPA